MIGTPLAGKEAGEGGMCLELGTAREPLRAGGWTRAGEENGAELVEAAILLPVLLMLLIGIVGFGMAYNVYQTITHAAREGGRFAVPPTCATCGNSIPSDDEIRAVIHAALSAAALDPSQVNPNPIPILRNQLLNPGSTPEERGVVIAFRYPFQFLVPFTSVHLTTLSIPTQVQMREE